MSHEKLEVVRQPIAVRAHSRRRLEQRLARFPRLATLITKAIWLLGASAFDLALRQAIARHYVQQGFEALNRRDCDAAFMLYHPDVESIFPAQLASLGLESSRGRKVRLEREQQWQAMWGDWRFEPQELIDLGDRGLLVIGAMRGRGASSGAEIINDGAFLFTLASARVIREQVFLDRQEALQAVGLAE